MQIDTAPAPLPASRCEEGGPEEPRDGGVLRAGEAALRALPLHEDLPALASGFAAAAVAAAATVEAAAGADRLAD